MVKVTNSFELFTIIDMNAIILEFTEDYFPLPSGVL